MVETALLDNVCILFVTVATSDKKSVDSPIPVNKLSKVEDTLPIKLSSQASATTSFIPSVDDADISNGSPSFFFSLILFLFVPGKLVFNYRNIKRIDATY